MPRAPPAYVEHYAPQAQTQDQPLQPSSDLRFAPTHTTPPPPTQSATSPTPIPLSHDLPPIPNPVPNPNYANTNNLDPTDTASLLPPYTRSQPTHNHTPYGNYPSESAYLDALRAWAKEKEYMEPVDAMGRPTRLIGFYGSKTSEDYVREGVPLRWGRRGGRRRKGVGGDGGGGAGRVLREEEGSGVGERGWTGEGGGELDGGEGGGGGDEDEDGFGHAVDLERSRTAPSHNHERANTALGVGIGDSVHTKSGRRRSSISNWMRRMRTSGAG